MAGDLNINQVTVATTTADVDKLYVGKSPFGVTDDRAITYANFRSQLVTTDTYSGLSTTSKTVQGAINEVLGLINTENTWDRVDLGTSDFYLQPHTTTDGLLVGNIAGEGLAFKLSTFEVANAVTNTGVTLRTGGTQDLVYEPGVATVNAHSLTLESISNAASMTGAENGVMFRQYYYDAVTPLGIDEGYIGFVTEGNWTSTAATQNSAAKVRVLKAGVLTDAITVNSGGNTNIDYTSAVSTAYTNGLKISNYASDASMTGTENGIVFYQRYYLAISPQPPTIEGYVGFATEGNWTNLASTRGSAFKVRNIYQGNWVDTVSIASSGIPTFPALNTNGGIVQTNGSGVFSSSKTLASGITAPDFALTSAGTLNNNKNYLTITNTVNDGSNMGDTASCILFRQYYYDAVTPAAVDSGLIRVNVETNWTSTGSTQTSSMLFYTRSAGVLTGTTDWIMYLSGVSTDRTAYILSLGLKEVTAPSDPVGGYSKFYIDTNGLTTYKVRHISTTTTPFTLTAAGVPTFAGLTTNNGILTVNSSGYVSASVTLPNGTLCTTQAANDNSTKLATTAYIDGKTSFAAGLSLGGSCIIPLANRFIIGPDTTDGSFSFVVAAGHIYAQKYGSGSWGGAGQFLIL